MLPFHNVGLFSKPNRFGSVRLGSACSVNEPLITTYVAEDTPLRSKQYIVIAVTTLISRILCGDCPCGPLFVLWSCCYVSRVGGRFCVGVGFLV